MNPFDVLMKPVLSEKSNQHRENANKYTFMVARAASKDDVRKAVETMFNVKVAGVTTLVTRGKVKRRGNAAVKMPNVKKAYVTLVQGAKIPLFEDL